jgi:hypothetical protein
VNHNTASLLYNLVKDCTDEKLPRSQLFSKYPDETKDIQQWLKCQQIAVLPLACPVQRYAFELYASMSLKTGKLNTFETH